MLGPPVALTPHERVFCSSKLHGGVSVPFKILVVDNELADLEAEIGTELNSS